MPAGATVAEVAAGGSHSLALTSSGLVFAWGSDVFGQLSSALVATLPVDSDVPVQPLGLPPVTPFVHIAAGQDASYALTDNGVPWVWGGDYYGQLGDGTPGVNAVGPGGHDHPAPGHAGHGPVLGAGRVGGVPGDPGPADHHLPGVPAATYGDPPVNVGPTVDSGLGLTNTAQGSCTGALVRLFLTGAGLVHGDLDPGRLVPVLPGIGHHHVRRRPGGAHRGARPADRHRGHDRCRRSPTT